MSHININPDKITETSSLTSLCPFGSIEVSDGKIKINSSCRMCRLCVKNGPEGGFLFIEDTSESLDRSLWSGIAVYVEMEEKKIHPVSLEMIGKAEKLAAKIDQPVYALLPGYRLDKTARELQYYGVDNICVYDDRELSGFRIEPYTAVMEDFIGKFSPAVFLVGGTTLGRNLAPRTAARFRTGLTADCTILDINDSGDLDQIRPAFGGNIMAHIKTPAHRPQFATVRYRIFSAPVRTEKPSGIIQNFSLKKGNLESRIRILDTHHKEKVEHLEEAEIIIAAGRGIGKPENIGLINELSDLLGGQVAGTRPLVEAGIVDPRKQIGLSGRTVRPRLLITCGISGSVQFTAGMKGAEKIISINTDPAASIFETAHIGIIGDLTLIIPDLIDKIKSEKYIERGPGCITR